MKSYLLLALCILSSISLNGMDWYYIKQSIHDGQSNTTCIPKNKPESITAQKILNKDTKSK